MKKNKLKIRRNYNEGMTYVELIVVLAIFAVLSSVVLYNYREFQAKVDIKNLASDIALKIVEAQKSAISGVLPPAGAPSDTWKPAYGVYFDPSTDVDTSNPIPDTPFNKEFIYFADLNNISGYDTGDSKELITITKNNSISRIDSYLGSNPTQILTPFSIAFKRPDSSAIFYDLNGQIMNPVNNFDYLQITIISPQSSSATIKIYPSGRIQVN